MSSKRQLRKFKRKRIKMRKQTHKYDLRRLKERLKTLGEEE
jgi:hypothetical protein